LGTLKLNPNLLFFSKAMSRPGGIIMSLYSKDNCPDMMGRPLGPLLEFGKEMKKLHF
jgi:hypothetical protein